MAITVHPPRQQTDAVPPGAWEGTKQDAVLATAQLLEVLSRKKSGERAQFGDSEYDAEMAVAQLRAFKLTKVILNKTKPKSNSAPASPTLTKAAFPSPSSSPKFGGSLSRSGRISPLPLPSSPLASSSDQTELGQKARSKSSSPARKSVPRPRAVPESRFPPPIPPRKSSNRLSPLPPPVSMSQRRYSDEVSPRTIPHSPIRLSRPASPLPPALSPCRKSFDKADKQDLPVAPFRRVKFQDVDSALSDTSTRCETPLLEDKPALPHRSPLRMSTYEQRDTEPLNPKRRSLQRSVSFRFGEGINGSGLSRTSSLICSELSDALIELQRAIGAAAVEVH